MTFAEKMRSKIDVIKREERALWDKVSFNSKDYMEELQINKADLKRIERSQGHLVGYPSLEDLAINGFLHFGLDGERFALFVKNVCACDYGAGWEYVVMAVCKSNTSFNKETGHGTALISAVSDEWHQKIIKYLKEKE